MPNRRIFLKHVTMLGIGTATPISFALGQNESSQMPDMELPDGAFAVSHRQVRRTAPPPRKITIPDVGEYKVLKGDFHIHSVFSDGVAMPKDRVLEAIDNGLDVISITDHIEYRPFFGNNHISYGGPNRAGNVKLLDKNDDHNIAFDLAKPEADRQNLILVRGTEITKRTMPPGDLNAIFIEDANPIAAVVDDWKEMLAVASDQGGFVFWVHPGSVAPTNGGLQPGEPMSFTSEHEDVYKKGHLHGVEIFNGSTYYPIVSQWCAERNLAMLATSDVHGTEWNTYGHQNPLRPITLILAKERTHDSVREAFFARRTIGFAAGMVLGSREWLEKLFTACVTMIVRPGLLELTNKSDIPCLVQAGGAIRELPVQGQLSMYRGTSVKKLTVSNWLVDVGKPLEIDLPL